MATITEPATSSSAKKCVTGVQPSIDLMGWIEENRDKFKPPVSNRYLYDGRDFFVMVIKGPNARNDFHLVDSEEYFYQLKGDIKVRIRRGRSHRRSSRARRRNVFYSAQCPARAGPATEYNWRCGRATAAAR